jgi:hypothetical protein
MAIGCFPKWNPKESAGLRKSEASHVWLPPFVASLPFKNVYFGILASQKFRLFAPSSLLARRTNLVISSLVISPSSQFDLSELFADSLT